MMKTSRTSSATTQDVRRAALFDELSKLASEEPVKKPSPKDRWKRIAKAGALAGGGYVAGHGAAMLADHAVTKAFGKKYPNWSTSTKKKVIYPLLGLAAAGAALSSVVQPELRRRVIEGE
jgi:hypothetical protein